MQAFIGLLLVLVSTVLHARPYQFPIEDPFAATVVGTPVALQAPRLRQEQIRWRQERVQLQEDNSSVPEFFWYAQSLRYTTAFQKTASPLVFIIGGLGGSASSSKMISLQRSFFTAGYHVIGLPSPTNPDFMVSAEALFRPGLPRTDIPVIYAAMQTVLEDVKQKYLKLEITDFYLTGFSLGGFHAAFLAQYDDEQGVFGFKRVLMINPPVNLYNSGRILDELVDERGINEAPRFIVQVLDKLGSLLQRVDGVRLMDSDFFYQLYLRDKPEQEDLKMLIGVVFRLFAMGITLTSDELSRGNLLIPSSFYLDKFSTTTPFFLIGRYLGFVDYFDRLLLPALKAREPGLTREQVIQRMSLHAIQDYLAENRKIGVVTNANDFILAPGELLFLQETFVNRSKVYPLGGHLGNIDEREFVANMLWFFQRH